MRKKLKRFFAVFLCVFVITNTVFTAKVQAVPIVVGGLVTVGVLLLAATGYVAVKNGVDIPIPDNQKMVNFMADFIEEHQGAYDTVSGWWGDIKNKANSLTVAGATLAAMYTKGATDMFKFGVKDTDNVKVPINSEVESIIKDAVKEYYRYPEISAGTSSVVVNPAVESISSVLVSMGYTYREPTYDKSVYPYLFAYKKEISGQPYLRVLATSKPLVVLERVYDYTSYKLIELVPYTDVDNTVCYDMVYYWDRYGRYFEAEHSALNSSIINYGYIGTPFVVSYSDYVVDRAKNIELVQQAFVYSNYDIKVESDIAKTVVNTDVPTYVIDGTKYAVEPKDTAVISANSVLQRQLENIDNIANTDIVVRAIDNANKIAERTGTNVIDVGITGTGIADDAKWYDVAVSSLKDFAKWLFIPSSAAVNEFVQEATNKVEGQPNIFTYPLELVIKFLMAVALLGKSDCILTLPRIEFNGHLLYGGSSFNFTDYVEQSQFAYLYRLYYYFIDFLMIICMLNLATKKWDEIIRGN